MSDPTDEEVERAVKRIAALTGASEDSVREAARQLLNAPKLSCVACITNPLGWNAKHVCGYPDDVAAASGIA